LKLENLRFSRFWKWIET